MDKNIKEISTTAVHVVYATRASCLYDTLWLYVIVSAWCYYAMVMLLL